MDELRLVWFGARKPAMEQLGLQTGVRVDACRGALLHLARAAERALRDIGEGVGVAAGDGAGGAGGGCVARILNF